MSKSEVIRIPARARPAWARLVAKMRGDLGQEIPESECFSLLLSEWDIRTGGPGVLPDDAPFYEVMPEPLDLPDRIGELNTRIDRLERDAFWRKLEENPPEDGFVPILPSPEWLEEARERFPEIYKPKSD